METRPLKVRMMLLCELNFFWQRLPRRMVLFKMTGNDLRHNVSIKFYLPPLKRRYLRRFSLNYMVLKQSA